VARTRISGWFPPITRDLPLGLTSASIRGPPYVAEEADEVHAAGRIARDRLRAGSTRQRSNVSLRGKRCQGLSKLCFGFGSSGVLGGYNLAFAATRFAASTWPRGPETLAPCHNCMSHQELGLLWAIQPPETPEEPRIFAFRLSFSYLFYEKTF